MSARRTRPRGYADWTPRAESEETVRAVLHVLEEYERHLPLTIRQCFYRLVATIDYPKTERDYSRLCELLNRARRAGLVPWDAIRDDRATVTEPWGYGSPQEFLRLNLNADDYRRHPRDGQPLDVLVVAEASGMLPMLATEVLPYGGRVMSSGGFDSVTVKRDIAKRAHWRPLVVLHVGDHDPSGVHVFSSFAEDVQAFARAEGTDVQCKRIAVTPAQIERLNLPTAPPKATDRRAFDGETVQAEALPPDELCLIVRSAVEGVTDLATLVALRIQEAQEREALRARLVEVSGALEVDR